MIAIRTERSGDECLMSCSRCHSEQQEVSGSTPTHERHSRRSIRLLESSKTKRTFRVILSLRKPNETMRSSTGGSDAQRSYRSMRTSFLLLCVYFIVKPVQSTQCKSSKDIVGHCGCCALIGGVCKHYETIDGVAAAWHLCVPAHLEKTFSLEQCKPKIFVTDGPTRICRTQNETLRLFPQCATKEMCLTPKPLRLRKSKCQTAMAVKGSCQKSVNMFTYDAQRRACVPFVYSGCGGTSNRFLRQDRCEKFCLRKT